MVIWSIPAKQDLKKIYDDKKRLFLTFNVRRYTILM